MWVRIMMERDETWHADRIYHIDLACKITTLAHHAICIHVQMGLMGKIPVKAGNSKILRD
jgi:hypothetical protein